MSASTNRTAAEAEGMSVGSTVADFSAEDLHGQSWRLYDALGKGPVVIIFYRGQWCPICNTHLKKLQDGLASIQAKGATVVAVSPERSEFLKRTQEKTKAEFSLLYDEDYRISDQFDLTFKPDSKSIFMYNTMLGAKLKVANTDDSERLPIPATYIIGTDKKVVWRHVDPNYKNRSSVEDILANLP